MKALDFLKGVKPIQTKSSVETDKPKKIDCGSLFTGFFSASQKIDQEGSQKRSVQPISLVQQKYSEEQNEEETYNNYNKQENKYKQQQQSSLYQNQTKRIKTNDQSNTSNQSSVKNVSQYNPQNNLDSVRSIFKQQQVITKPNQQISSQSQQRVKEISNESTKIQSMNYYQEYNKMEVEQQQQQNNIQKPGYFNPFNAFGQSKKNTNKNQKLNFQENNKQGINNNNNNIFSINNSSIQQNYDDNNEYTLGVVLPKEDEEQINQQLQDNNINKNDNFTKSSFKNYFNFQKEKQPLNKNNVKFKQNSQQRQISQDNYDQEIHINQQQQQQQQQEHIEQQIAKQQQQQLNKKRQKQRSQGKFSNIKFYKEEQKFELKTDVTWNLMLTTENIDHVQFFELILQGNDLYEYLPEPFCQFNIENLKSKKENMKIQKIILLLKDFEIFDDVISAKFIDFSGEIIGSMPRKYFCDDIENTLYTSTIQNEQNDQDSQTSKIQTCEDDSLLKLISGSVYILKNVTLFLPNEDTFYLNIQKKNIEKVFLP